MKTRLLTLILALMASTLWAADFKSGELYYNITSATAPYKVEVTYESRSNRNYINLTSIEIPTSVNHDGIDYAVTGIGEYAFFSCQHDFSTIEIPEGIEYIGNEAFAYSDFDTIIIPKSLKSIGKKVFTSGKSVIWNARNCADTPQPGSPLFDSDITSFVFGDEVEYIPAWLCYKIPVASIEIPQSVTSIGNHAFYACKALASIHLPNSIVSIGESAFSCCDGLTSITIPESVTSIGEYAFYGCEILASITIPKSVTSIGKCAFKYCSSLSSVIWNARNCADVLDLFYQTPVTSFTFGEDVKRIPGRLCEEITTLTSVTIPENVTSIGSRVFSGCTALTSVQLPTNLTSISNYLFYGCSALSSITIPEEVTSIEDYAFCRCYGLTAITIPESVISIGHSAFYGCINLATATILSSTADIMYNAFGGCYFTKENFINNSHAMSSDSRGATIVDEEIDGLLIKDSTIISARTHIKVANIPTHVIGIADKVFVGCEHLTSISIPDNSVRTIGKEAFNGCQALNSVTIGEGVTKIGEKAFYDCTSLNSVTIGDGVTSIGYEAFSNTGIYNDKSKWTNGILQVDNYIIKAQTTLSGDYTVDDTIYAIASGAFEGCSSITSLNLGNGVKGIGYKAFYGCSSIEAIEIPASVIILEDMAFSGCSLLTSITWNAKDCEKVYANETPMGSLPGMIGSPVIKDAFAGIREQITSFTIGADIEKIPSNLCYKMSLLKSIDFPSGLKEIGYSAFSGCKVLKSITIPQGVTSIESAAFSNCSSLKTITIPENVASIGDEAFWYCPALTSIVWNAKECADFYENMAMDSPDCIPFEGKYITSITFGDKVEHIPGYFCCGGMNITSITIPESVLSIGRQAFYGCKLLTSVSIPDNVESIGGSAFYNCESLSSIVIGNGVKSIGDYAFDNCEALSTVILGSALESIGYRAFAYCSSITTLTIPEKVTTIGEAAFRYCTSLESVVMNEGLTSIGTGAFLGCSSLTDINLPNSLITLEGSVFKACSALTSITIPENVIKLDCSDFENCQSLTSVVWNAIDASTDDGYSPFYYIENKITSFTFGDKVKCIPTGLCRNQTGLTSITLPESVKSIGKSAFYGCSGLTSFTIPKSVTDIESYAFAECSGLLDVYCHAAEVPTTASNAFNSSNHSNASLHVPATALEAYKTTAPWSSFGTILPIEGEQPDEPAEEGWSEWEAVGTAVTIRGKEAMMTSLQYWGEGEIAPWEEPITIDQRYDRADPTKKQLRLNGIFNAKEIVLDYDSSTGKISAENQSSGYATNKAMIEGQGVSNPYDEFIFSLNTGTYRSATGVIDMSNAFFYINEQLGLSMGFTLQIEGVTPPTFTGQWDRKYVGREGGKATFTLTFEEPIVKYRALVLAPGESLTVSAVSALYAAKPETDLRYEETDSPTFAIACDKMGTYRVVFVPIGADGTAVLNYQLTSIVSYAEPAYETYEWEYIGESTVSEHVGSLLISNEELWEEGEDGWVNRYPFMTTSEGVKTYRRADNPNIIGLCNLYGENHPYSSMFTYVDQTQDWWVYIDVTNPKDVKLLTTPVGAVSTQVGYGTFITQYSDAGAATLSDGVVTFPRGSVLLNNVLNQDMQAAFDFKVILPTEEEPGNMVNQIELNQTSTTLIEGETMTLTATVTPDDADDTSVTWSSSDEAVATVDAQGKVTAVASGFAIITATANDGSGVSASCNVTVLGIYSITYLLDGEVYYYDELVQGTKIVLPKEPVKEGYTFSGWGEVPETMPAEDVIVEGTFVVNKYLVTFRIGDEVVAADSLEYGAVIVVPDAPAKEGYTFNGWGEVPETMPAEDVIVEGTYTVNVYKVYYYVGEELVHTDEVAYGEVIPEYVYEPTAEGDVFMGWLGETYETMPAHDVTYTANIESSIHHSILNSHDTVIYDLSGRRVLNVENLTGVYIINGKRVLIK